MSSTASARRPPSSPDLGHHRLDGDAVRARGSAAVPAVAAIAKPERDEAPGHLEPGRLVPVGQREEHGARRRAARSPAAIWLLAKASPKVASIPITSPVERISGPSSGVDAGEAVEGQHRLLHADVAERLDGGRAAAPSSRSSAERGARPSPGPRPWPAARRSPWRRTARCGSPAGWPRARRPAPSFTAYCTLTRPDARRARRRWPGCGARCIVERRRRARVWRRERAGRVARVHARLLDVLHDPADRAPRRCASRTASTSTSTASSRKRSTSTGRSARQPALAAERAGRQLAPSTRLERRRRRRRSPSPARRARSSAAPAPGSRPARPPRSASSTRGGRAARRLGDARAGRTARSTARGPRPGRSTPGCARARARAGAAGRA